MKRCTLMVNLLPSGTTVSVATSAEMHLIAAKSGAASPFSLTTYLSSSPSDCAISYSMADANLSSVTSEKLVGASASLPTRNASTFADNMARSGRPPRVLLLSKKISPARPQIVDVAMTFLALLLDALSGAMLTYLDGTEREVPAEPLRQEAARLLRRDPIPIHSCRWS